MCDPVFYDDNKAEPKGNFGGTTTQIIPLLFILKQLAVHCGSHAVQWSLENKEVTSKSPIHMTTWPLSSCSLGE